MNNANSKIVFLGTPDFAVASLNAIVENGFSVIAVVTAPDKPAGRGLRLSESSIKQYANKKSIPVLQPFKLKDPVFLEHLKSLHADLQVVVAFRMLPEIVWSMPPFGTINLHGSLLPQYRGAAPINRAIMNGETRTGVTTFKLQQEIDTGDILLMEEMDIGPDETAGELHDRMKETGAGLVVKTIRGLMDGSLHEKPQPFVEPGSLKQAPKIFAEDCLIRWEDTVNKIHNQIRGLSPFPGAFTTFNEKNLKIFRSTVKKEECNKIPGIAETNGKSWLRFAASDGYIYVEEMQLEGKKKMTVGDFLKGYRP
ncbi:MAG: methionyl-tRNA formyltransferase [Bacteroidota bacterium]|nr:methionyl-tRNA formyltransferase [Bacteroidota bacterium]